MPSEHYKVTFDLVHVSAERKHVKGMFGICLELCPILMQMSHITQVAASK